MTKTLKEILESFDFNRAALAKQRLQNLRHSGRRVRGSSVANLMRAAGLKEEEMDETDLDQLDEVLSADADASEWIHDFVKSDDPKFSGKSKKERIKMALGAYYGKKRAQDGEGLGEEVEFEEAFINGREYASQGVMHPDHAKLHKVGVSRDFYAHGTGDKLSGTVTHNDGKEVHIKAEKTSGGKVHKFKVSSTLPKPVNEGAFSSGALKAPKSWLDAAKKIPSKGTVRGRDEKGVYTAKTENGKEVSRVYEDLEEAAYAGLEKEDKPGKVKTAVVKTHPKAVESDTVEGWKDPKKPVKESYDEEGNLITMSKTFQEFMLEYEIGPGGRYVHKGTYGSAKGAKFGNTDYDNEDLEKKDDEGQEQQKRGRGRPAGSKSGARGPRIK